MRAVPFGLLAGFLLSVGRAPTGFDLFELPAPFASTRYGVRAFALALVGLAAFTRGRSATAREPVQLLGGALLGYAVHGLWLADALAFDGLFGLVATALALFVLLLVARPATVKRAPAPAGSEPYEEGAPGPVELFGSALAGLGCALALEGLARWVALLSDGARDDDTGFTLAFLLMAFIGATSFGGLARLRPLRQVAFPVGLAGVAAAALAGLAVLGNLSSARGQFRYFHHPVIALTGIESTRHGTLFYDLLVGGSCFVVPGMLLGAVLDSTSRRARLASALLGASVGLVLVPALLSATGVEPSAAERAGRISPDLVSLGALLAGAGAALAALAAPRNPAPRFFATVAAALLGALPFALPVEPAAPSAPWRKVPVAPRKTFETREGMVTLEGLGSGIESVTLDRRVLAPDRERADSDAERLRISMQLCDPFQRARQAVRVLLIGQLTPGRAQGLSALGAARVDRSAAWWRALDTIERAVFQDEPRPAGDILAPGEARERARRGDYDLVLVPSVPGDVPRAPGDLVDGRWLDLGEHPTVVVAWIDLRFPSAHVDFGERVLLVTDGVSGLGAGVVRGASPELAETFLSLPIGERHRWRAPLPRMLMRDEERSYLCLEELGRRLAEGVVDAEGAALPRALVEYFGAQRRSSPFEHAAARVEIPHAALDALLEHSRGRPLDGFTRALWEELALVLAGKRWVPEILDYLPLLLEEHGPWPTLQRVVARALLESFEPAEALAVLAGVTEREPGVRDGWTAVGEAQRMLGRHREAAAAFREAHRIDPHQREVHRALAIEAALAGDTDAQALIEELLLEHPDDDGLLPYRGPGPYPEPDEGFRPNLFQRTHQD